MTTILLVNVETSRFCRIHTSHIFFGLTCKYYQDLFRLPCIVSLLFSSKTLGKTSVGPSRPDVSPSTLTLSTRDGVDIESNLSTQGWYLCLLIWFRDDRLSSFTYYYIIK